MCLFDYGGKFLRRQFTHAGLLADRLSVDTTRGADLDQVRSTLSKFPYGRVSCVDPVRFDSPERVVATTDNYRPAARFGTRTWNLTTPDRVRDGDSNVVRAPKVTYRRDPPSSVLRAFSTAVRTVSCVD